MLYVQENPDAIQSTENGKNSHLFSYFDYMCSHVVSENDRELIFRVSDLIFLAEQVLEITSADISDITWSDLSRTAQICLGIALLKKQYSQAARTSKKDPQVNMFERLVSDYLDIESLMSIGHLQQNEWSYHSKSLADILEGLSSFLNTAKPGSFGYQRPKGLNYGSPFLADAVRGSISKTTKTIVDQIQSKLKLEVSASTQEVRASASRKLEWVVHTVLRNNIDDLSYILLSSSLNQFLNLLNEGEYSELLNKTSTERDIYNLFYQRLSYNNPLVPSAGLLRSIRSYEEEKRREDWTKIQAAMLALID